MIFNQKILNIYDFFYCQAQLQLQLQLQLKLSLALFSFNPSHMWLLASNMWLLATNMWLLASNMWLLAQLGQVLKQALFEGFNIRSAQFQHLQGFLTKNIYNFLLPSSAKLQLNLT